MAMTFYPDEAHIHVDNPGYGELVLWWQTPDGPEDPVTVTGPRIARLLERITAVALGNPDVSRSMIPRDLDQRAAARLLPSFQRAVILATAGTDRYEALHPEPEDGPRPPICVRCGINGSATIDDARLSGYCLEHGHTPFGAGSGTTWDQAVTRYETQKTLWEARHGREH
ncbi:hypothetical protein [Kocuria arenosa]|uniref:hypothetical protein n=1 Tax=Kocuria arenosa TaxID=3071446 RepID=UPI0034D6EC52